MDRPGRRQSPAGLCFSENHALLFFKLDLTVNYTRFIGLFLCYRRQQNGQQKRAETMPCPLLAAKNIFFTISTHRPFMSDIYSMAH